MATLGGLISRLVEDTFSKTGKGKLFTTGTVVERLHGGMYLVSVEGGTFFMSSATDELLSPGNVVWVGHSDRGPFVIGGVK